MSEANPMKNELARYTEKETFNKVTSACKDKIVQRQRNFYQEIGGGSGKKVKTDNNFDKRTARKEDNETENIERLFSLPFHTNRSCREKNPTNVRNNTQRG